MVVSWGGLTSALGCLLTPRLAVLDLGDLVRLVGAAFLLHLGLCRLVCLWQVSWGVPCSWLLSNPRLGRFAMLQPCQVTALPGNKLET